MCLKEIVLTGNTATVHLTLAYLWYFKRSAETKPTLTDKYSEFYFQFIKKENSYLPK